MEVYDKIDEKKLLRESCMFSDFIKHYNIIRTILRDVFLYGCFSRGGLEYIRNISPRKVSYEMRRIQQYVEEEFIKVDRDGRYKLLSLTYDSIRNTDNFLVSTYMTKSFTRTDLLLYFYLLMALYSMDKPVCFKDIEEYLISEGLISYDEVSSKTIERKLDEMCKSLGVLSCDTIRRTKHYSIAPDILETLEDNEAMELLTAVSLFKNIQVPITAGYYCEQTLRDYITYEREISLEYMDYFQFRNLHFHPVIEEQVLYQLMKAIHQNSWISLNYGNTEKRAKDSPKYFIKPYKLRYDIHCGRYYLIAFDGKQKCIVARVDRIESIDFSKETFTVEGLQELYEKEMKHAWSSVHLGNSMLEEVELEITVKEPEENYIIERIRNEVPQGNMEKIKQGKYRLTLLCNYSSEMVPWIRSYSGYIKVLRGELLAKGLESDWKEMLKNYGNI